VVDIGFDAGYDWRSASLPPVAGKKGITALVDTGATDCCIDNMLAAHLNLPIIDKRFVSGIHGKQEVNMHLAQIHVPALGITVKGAFAGVDLVAGGHLQHALIGRTFLKHCRMTYDGQSGSVDLSCS
jgi:predicted aspartyl protease